MTGKSIKICQSKLNVFIIKKTAQPSFGVKEFIGRKLQALPLKRYPDRSADLEKDRCFYEESGGGITLSGGEVLQQHAFATARC